MGLRYEEHKEEIAKNYQNKKESINARRRVMKKEISKKNADYYKRNALKIRQKSRENYAKNKGKSLKKKSDDEENLTNASIDLDNA